MTKPILTTQESARLSAQLRAQKRKNPLTQMSDNYRVIVPDTLPLSLVAAGRRKYAALVQAAHMSLRWKGWRAKSGRKKDTGKTRADIDGVRRKRRIEAFVKVEHDVMLTRRFMATHYGYNECTTEVAIATLKSLELVERAEKAAFSGKEGANKGDTYKPLWMYEKCKTRNAWLFWGTLTSEAFLNLDVVSQAIFILLHFKIHRNTNIIVCHPGDLVEFGVSRKIVTQHLTRLMHSGLLEHMDGHAYRFPWMLSPKKVDSGLLIKKTVSLKQAGHVPKIGQEGIAMKHRICPQNRPRETQSLAPKTGQSCIYQAHRVSVLRSRSRVGEAVGRCWLPSWRAESEQAPGVLKNA